MKSILSLIASLALGIASSLPAQAGENFHDEPFDFLFGNHIDTHQETRLTIDKATGLPKRLFGKFYVIFTGETDSVSGLPIARHPRGLSEEHDERCGISVDCTVGWIMRGIPGAAKFLYHSGVNDNDHPVWMVNRAEEASAPSPGMVIPQPGSYTHFHWITNSSTDPRVVRNPGSIPAECDKSRAGQLEEVAPSAVDFVCAGWFLQIRAQREFAFLHGGEVIPVHPGMDNRSHLNLVTNFSNTVEITHTRVNAGH